MKKVLGLIASPRKGGNSELAVREMMRRFPDDWEKGMIRLTDLDIAYCRACYACLSKGKGCVLEDDMAFAPAELAAALKEHKAYIESLKEKTNNKTKNTPAPAGTSANEAFDLGF